MQRYKVTCTDCKRSDIVTIDRDTPVMYEKFAKTPLLSYRKRPDNQLGWQCVCGNYDLLAQQEKSHWKDLVVAGPMRLKEISDMLKESKVRFTMEEV